MEEINEIQLTAFDDFLEDLIIVDPSNEIKGIVMDYIKNRSPKSEQALVNFLSPDSNKFKKTAAYCCFMLYYHYSQITAEKLEEFRNFKSNFEIIKIAKEYGLGG